MWYDKRWMKVSFYFGAMFVLIGLGVAYMDRDYRLWGALSMCLGAALMVYGFSGIIIHAYIDQEFRRKKRRRPSSQGR